MTIIDWIPIGILSVCIYYTLKNGDIVEEYEEHCKQKRESFLREVEELEARNETKQR